VQKVEFNRARKIPLDDIEVRAGQVKGSEGQLSRVSRLRQKFLAGLSSK